MSKIDIEVGQIWRDTYPDDRKTGWKGKRTVRVVRQEGDGRWLVELVTDQLGNPPKGAARVTRVSLKTFRSGYELQEGRK